MNLAWEQASAGVRRHATAIMRRVASRLPLPSKHSQRSSQLLLVDERVESRGELHPRPNLRPGAAIARRRSPPRSGVATEELGGRL